MRYKVNFLFLIFWAAGVFQGKFCNGYIGILLGFAIGIAASVLADLISKKLQR